MRNIGLLAAVPVLVAACAVPSQASEAAGETCLGQPATIVGTEGAELVGSDGPDVIVTAGGVPVLAGDGDDLVCVTGGTSAVNAGPGDDTVDATLRQGPLRTELGEGDDTFVGGPGFDYVTAGPLDTDVAASLDDGRDSIATGDGGASVTTGQELLPNDDTIDLGSASGRTNEVVFRGTQTTSGSLDFGSSPGALLVRNRTNVSKDWLVDNRRHAVKAAGQIVVAWSGQAHTFSLDLGASVGRDVTFLGTAIAERLGTTQLVGRVDARMGDGRDVVNVGCRGLEPGSQVLFGAGLDKGVVNRGFAGGCRRVTVRLDRGLLAPGVKVRGMEVVDASGMLVGVHGDGRANVIRVRGCQGVVHAGAGADRVVATLRICVARDQLFRLNGEGGADFLRGSTLDDVLVGGPGRDVAVGGEGIDTCLAEVTRRCER